MSKKVVFSLMSLITILVLAFVVSSAMAEFDLTVTGPKTAYFGTNDAGHFGALIPVRVELKVVAAQLIPELAFTLTGIRQTTTAADTDNITVTAYDEEGFLINLRDGTSGGTVNVGEDMGYDGRTGTHRQLEVTILPGGDSGDANNLAGRPIITEVIITVNALKTTDPRVIPTDDDDMAHMSEVVHHRITLLESGDTRNLPKVVSVQRLRLSSQSVVSAFQEEKIEPEPFDVRIVLTDAPHGIDLAAANAHDLLVEVENGTVSNLVVGVPFTWYGGTFDHDNNAATPEVGGADRSLRPHPSEGMYRHAGSYDTPYEPLVGVPPGFDSITVPWPTSHDGSNDKYYQYRVTITPHQKSADFKIKVRVKEFHDNGILLRQRYVPPDFGDSDFLPNGRDILSINVKGAARNLAAGYRVTIPKDWIIPAGGYLIIAQDKAGSEIDTTGQDADRTDDTPRATHRTPAQLLYNVYATADLPNLATQFLNGVVVDVESQHAGLVISEVMWGEDVSLDPSSKSQYIELYNSGAQYKTVEDADHTPLVNEALTLIFYAPNEFSDIPAMTAVAATATAAATTALPTGLTDRIGTLDAKGTYWSPAAKGQSGRSGTSTGELTAGRGPFVDAVPIVSMYRGMVPSTAVGAAVGAMMVDDGQMAASWMSSEGPKSANFDPGAIGVRHGTPGAATDATETPADTAAEEKAKADKAAAALKKTESTGTMPEDGRIYISEIMFAGGGVLPQWIEIANGSKSEEINLSGWTLTVANAAADADVSVGATATFTIADGTTIDMSGQTTSPSTVLVVTEKGRYDLGKGAGQIINLMEDNEVDLILAGVTTRKYTLLSGEAFMITLAPPEPEATKPAADETKAAKATREAAEKKAAAKRKAATDMVGNLGADGAAAWALPMSEDGRSSIIRRHVQVAIGPAEPEDGTMVNNWVLASDTAFAQPTHIRAASYYGAANDAGTPGFRAGGALPVELSHFRPARDKETGAVVITWSTQSELNNAGFFIKRSQQKDGEFKVINAAMIAGAGTTSEKQFYTYTDTTAQPNVVYYYQIEDVSLDGNRQTLTRGMRLKGHVSVAGKATLTWGELKTSQ